MRVVVVGSTGLVGAEVVRQCSKAQVVTQVVAMARREIAFDDPKIRPVIVDFNRLDHSASHFTGDAIVLTLGTTLAKAGSLKAQRVVDVDYQYQAAKLARQQNTGHCILVSSSGANVNSFSPYLKMKGDLEHMIASLEFERLTIVQPSLLLGERSDARRAEGIGAKVLPLMCKLPGLTKYRPIHAREVAARIVKELQQTNAGTRKFSLDDVFI